MPIDRHYALIGQIGVDGLPTGSSGDFLVYNGSTWVTRALLEADIPALSDYVEVAGDTMTGALTMSGADINLGRNDLNIDDGLASPNAWEFRGHDDTQSGVLLTISGTGGPEFKFDSDGVSRYEAALTIGEKLGLDANGGNPVINQVSSAESLTLGHSTGAHAVFYGGTHGSLASRSIVDAARHQFRSQDGLENLAVFFENGECEFYYNNILGFRVSNNRNISENLLAINDSSSILIRPSGGYYFNIGRTGTTQMYIVPSTASETEAFDFSKAILFKNDGQVDFQGGAEVLIKDSSNTDWAAFQHDGTHFKTTGTNTNDWDISGFTQIDIDEAPVILDNSRAFRGRETGGTSRSLVEMNSSNVVQLGASTNGVRIFGTEVWSEPDFYIRGGNSLRVYDSDNSDYVQFTHSGSNAAISVVNGNLHLNDIVEVQGGHSLRIRDSSNADYMQFSHDGTDANLNFVNTTDLDIHGVDTSLDNNFYYGGKESGGTHRHLIGMTSSNVIQVGSATNAINLTASAGVTLVNNDVGFRGRTTGAINTNLAKVTSTDLVELGDDAVTMNLEYSDLTLNGAGGSEGEIIKIVSGVPVFAAGTGLDASLDETITGLWRFEDLRIDDAANTSYITFDNDGTTVDVDYTSIDSVRFMGDLIATTLKSDDIQRETPASSASEGAITVLIDTESQIRTDNTNVSMAKITATGVPSGAKAAILRFWAEADTGATATKISAQAWAFPGNLGSAPSNSTSNHTVSAEANILAEQDYDNNTTIVGLDSSEQFWYAASFTGSGTGHSKRVRVYLLGYII